MIENLSKIFAEATAAIGQEYFRLPVAGGDEVYRERVYCYELYHQMRLRWPSNTRLRLNGEIDKRSHHLLEELGVNGEKPDFLIHEPDSMGSNCAIVEVKHAETSASGIRKDLGTLKLFKEKVGYTRALFLVFGFESEERYVQRCTEAAAKMGGAAGIELWLHAEAGKPARNLKTLS